MAQFGTPVGPRLRVLESGGQRGVSLDGAIIHLYDAHDRAAEAAAIALLARARGVKRGALAEPFGCDRNRVWRLKGRLQRAGMAAALPAKRRPKGPYRVTPEVGQVVRDLSHLGCVQVTRAIEQRTGVRLTGPYVSSGSQWESPRAAPASSSVLMRPPGYWWVCREAWLRPEKPAEKSENKPDCFGSLSFETRSRFYSRIPRLRPCGRLRCCAHGLASG